MKSIYKLHIHKRSIKSIIKLPLIILLFTVLFLISHQSLAKDLSVPSNSLISNKIKKIKVLSVDGGGIRGIIPALILQNLESRLKHGRHLTDCFDIMTGTSTGGIIVLMLNVRNKDGGPKYKASHIAELYKELGKEIFHDSLWNKVTSGLGWFGVRYPEENLEKALFSYFGDAELKDTITQVIIPAYDIEEDVNVFFTTAKAQKEFGHNYLLRDIARATSAAPTYFNPAQITDTTKTNTNVLVDGGVAVNNPTIAAIVEMIKMHGPNEYFLTVSLGTGTNYGAKSSFIKKKQVDGAGLIGWATKIIPLMMHAVNDVTNHQVDYIFNYNNPNGDHFRFQPIVEKEHDEMDNIRPKNIAALELYAKKIIEENEEALQKIADILNSDAE